MNAVVQYMCEVLSEKFLVPAEEVGPTAEFAAMDLDSLVLVELAVSLTQRYGVQVSDWEIEAAGTIENTAGLLLRKDAPLAV
ncbi:acyl carrier protein [Streptomyces sp. NPDC048258]|uniref:acyl carrier protein n=1 Tax=Streptomyces sp. NPDC048258 TaxID=3365527 RepID=UPI003712073B